MNIEAKKRICTIVFFVAIINFFAFIVGTIVLGGDAVSGKVEGGRYYVSNHGKPVEVSHAAFIYSRIHCYAVWTTHPLGIFCVWLIARREKPIPWKRKPSVTARTHFSHES